jgi:hypothetical protein
MYSFRSFLFAGPCKPIQRDTYLSGRLPYGGPYIPLYGLPREPFLEFQRRFV